MQHSKKPPDQDGCRSYGLTGKSKEYYIEVFIICNASVTISVR